MMIFFLPTQAQAHYIFYERIYVRCAHSMIRLLFVKCVQARQCGYVCVSSTVCVYVCLVAIRFQFTNSSHIYFEQQQQPQQQWTKNNKINRNLGKNYIL